MGFWVFMTAMDMLIPLVMLIFGAVFIRRAPKKINYFFGYRTERSMKNKDTWEFAHKYIGKIWLVVGAILLVLSLAVMLFLYGASEAVISLIGTVLTFLQLVGIIVPVFPTERALSKGFDNNGNRK